MHCPANENFSVYKKIKCNPNFGVSAMMTLAEAINFCNNLVLKNRDNWRLPSIKELQSIATYYDTTVPRINATAFPINNYNEIIKALWSIPFWSSTATQSENSTKYYTVDFAYGSIAYGANDTTTKKFVRCVSSN